MFFFLRAHLYRIRFIAIVASDDRAFFSILAVVNVLLVSLSYLAAFCKMHDLQLWRPARGSCAVWMSFWCGLIHPLWRHFTHHGPKSSRNRAENRGDVFPARPWHVRDPPPPAIHTPATAVRNPREERSLPRSATSATTERGAHARCDTWKCFERRYVTNIAHACTATLTRLTEQPTKLLRQINFRAIRQRCVQDCVRQKLSFIAKMSVFQ